MSDTDEIHRLLLRLLHAIREGDVDTYEEICDENLSCFEPETKGHNINGLAFHNIFMSNSKIEQPYHIELVNPVIKVFGDTAYAAYTLIQQVYKDNSFTITSVNETRIFHRIGNWKLIHFHRSK